MCGKVCRCINLMNGPFIFNPISIQIGNRESCMFNSMCKLKNDADQQSGYCCSNEKSDSPHTHTRHINGQCDKNKSMYHFKEPEIEMIHKGHFLHWHFANLLPKIFIII